MSEKNNNSVNAQENVQEVDNLEKKREIGKKKRLKNLLPPFSSTRQANPETVGRPLGSVSIVTVLKRMAAEHPEKITAATQTWLNAMSKDAKFAQIVLDRLDGAVPQKLLLDDLRSRGKRLAIELAPLIPEDKKEEAIAIVERIFNDE